MNIRPLDIADYEAIYSLWSSLQGIGLSQIDDSREGISRFLTRNPRTNFVAFRDGRIVGTILCDHDGRRAHIYHAAVGSEWRGKGIGRALVERALASLRDEGVSKVSLVVFKTNEVGNEFWEALDFRREWTWIIGIECFSKGNRVLA